MSAKTKPQMIRLNIDEQVNRLALSAAALFEQLSPAEILKVDREFGDGMTKVRTNAAGFKKLTCLIGFMYVQAIKEARNQLREAKPLPNQKNLFPERTNA